MKKILLIIFALSLFTIPAWGGVDEVMDAIQSNLTSASEGLKELRGLLTPVPPVGTPTPPTPPPVTEPPTAGLKGVGGLEALPEAYRSGVNVLAGQGFEEGETGWKHIGKCFSIDETVAHSGSKSLKFEHSTGCSTVRQLGIRPNATAYSVSGWVKMEGVNPEAKIIFYLFDQTHKSMIVAAMSVKAKNVKGSDWKFFIVKNAPVTLHHKKDALELRIKTSGVTSGKIWVDDLKVASVYRPLKVFVTYPNYRGYMWDDKSQVVTGIAEVAPATGQSLDLSIVSVASGKTLMRKTITEPQDENPFSFDISHLPQGEYFIRSALYNGIGVEKYPDYRIVKVSAAHRAKLNNWIDADNVLHHGGKKRFVWGVYDRMSGKYRCPKGCLSYTQKGYETKIKGFDGLGMMDTYLDSGVNLVLDFVTMAGANPGVGGRRNQIEPYVKALDARGIMHLQITNTLYGRDGKGCYGKAWYKPYWSDGLTSKESWEAISMSITSKGLLGYYTADEPGLGKLCGVFKQYQTLKEKDGITYEVFINPAQQRGWFDSADVFGTDPYPMGGGPVPDDAIYGEKNLGDRRHMGRTYGWTVDTVNNVKGSRPVWQVLQLFKLGGQFPNYDDMRKQAYSAIIGGADGILWWGFVHSVGMEAKWYIDKDYQAYYDFRKITKEVMALEDILLTPNVEGLVTSDNPKIAFIVKKASPGGYVVMAVNKTEVSQGSVTFNVKGRVAGVSLYEEQRDVAQTANSFKGNFGVEEVHIYKLNLR